MTLNILFGYNNYYNRLLKVEENISSYIDKAADFYITGSNVNFNPNDGVNTEHIIGQGDFSGEGDYLVVTNEYNEIISRWFILESQRTRAGQYKLILHRDVIADYYNLITQSPCFVEKAMLSYDSPLLFNKEDMSFNQIKSNETLLKDKSGCAWLVGYYDPAAENLTGSAKNNSNEKISVVHVGASVSDWWLYPYTSLANDPKVFGGPAINPVTAFMVTLLVYAGYTETYLVEIYGDATFTRKKVSLAGGAEPTFNQVKKDYGIEYGFNANETKTSAFDTKLTALLASSKSIFTTELEASTQYANSAPALEHYLGFDGWVIGNNTETEVYQITIQHPSKPTTTIDDVKNTGIGVAILSLMDSIKAYYHDGSEIVCKYDYNGYNMQLKTRVDSFVHYDITGNTQRLITEDAPYNIFAMPFGDITVNLGSSTFINNSNIALSTASAMLANHGGFIYDIQLLPYCPYPSLLTEGQVNLSSSAQYSLITQDSSGTTINKSVIIYVPKSKVEFNISNSIPIGETAIERKVNNECDKWRLSSPNYSNFFDFSVEMNYGVDYFNVDCDFKPYTPYIHVNPNFKNLYGADYNDPRGLICGGDFSITRVDNKWADYQIQNKNYSAIFDRQIQNMEVQNKAQNISTAANAILGTVQGAMTGAMTGGMVGGVGSIVGGGIIGGTTSALAGAVDVQIERMLQNETLDYTKDLYNMQLGNIQALPQTISKVSAFNSNNKIFPVLEYFTCTDQEKNALRNKIKYNGMTVGVVDTLENYVNVSDAYIKGKLIRLEGSYEDYHILNIIAEELNKGFFTPKGEQ